MNTKQWSAIKNPPEFGQTVPGVDTFAICEVGTKRETRVAQVIDEKDAHLIAAAPDLLKQLQWIAKFILTASDDGDAWCAVRNQPGAQEWSNEMRAAIAKAEYP